MSIQLLSVMRNIEYIYDLCYMCSSILHLLSFILLWTPRNQTTDIETLQVTYNSQNIEFCVWREGKNWFPTKREALKKYSRKIILQMTILYDTYNDKRVTLRGVCDMSYICHIYIYRYMSSVMIRFKNEEEKWIKLINYILIKSLYVESCLLNICNMIIIWRAEDGWSIWPWRGKGSWNMKRIEWCRHIFYWYVSRNESPSLSPSFLPVILFNEWFLMYTWPWT